MADTLERTSPLRPWAEHFARLSNSVAIVEDPFVTMVDLRVDLHPEPVAELRRLADAYFPLVPYYNLRPRDPNVPSAAEWLTAQRRRDERS